MMRWWTKRGEVRADTCDDGVKVADSTVSYRAACLAAGDDLQSG